MMIRRKRKRKVRTKRRGGTENEKTGTRRITGKIVSKSKRDKNHIDKRKTNKTKKCENDSQGGKIRPRLKITCICGPKRFTGILRRNLVPPML